MATPGKRKRWAMTTARVGTHALADALEDGWEPFAASGDRVLLKRSGATA